MKNMKILLLVSAMVALQGTVEADSSQYKKIVVRMGDPSCRDVYRTMSREIPDSNHLLSCVVGEDAYIFPSSQSSIFERRDAGLSNSAQWNVNQHVIPAQEVINQALFLEDENRSYTAIDDRGVHYPHYKDTGSLTDQLITAAGDNPITCTFLEEDGEGPTITFTLGEIPDNPALRTGNTFVIGENATCA